MQTGHGRHDADVEVRAELVGVQGRVLDNGPTFRRYGKTALEPGYRFTGPVRGPLERPPVAVLPGTGTADQYVDPFGPRSPRPSRSGAARFRHLAGAVFVAGDPDRGHAAEPGAGQGLLASLLADVVGGQTRLAVTLGPSVDER